MAVTPLSPRRAPAKAASKTSARRSSKAKWCRVFLGHLAETSNVTAAARKAKVATSTVYELRRLDAEFYRKWQIALCEGYDNLEFDLLARLRSGELRPAAGAKKGVRAFDNATSLRLLTAHRESVARERAIRDDEDADAILASINAKIDRMRERSLAAREHHDDGGAA